MTTKPLAVGDPIEARCTKCRTITNHTIVAMTDTKPAKVECNTCHGQHIYRQPKAPAAKKVDKVQKAKLEEQSKWAELETELHRDKAKAYSMDGNFEVGSFINHPQFGIGRVQEIAGFRKIEVLFEDGLKILRTK